MKKESKEMLKTIISNQELIMKALNIVVPSKEVKKAEPKKVEAKKAPAKAPVKKPAAKKSVKKVRRK